jgi:hypothetical protein
MTWAMRRRLIILGIIAGFIALALGIFYFTTIRTAPSCMDEKQNQDEEGIDCGGSCAYYCTESQAAASVKFVRPLTPTPGRTDVIAYIDNPNGTAAANDLHFTVELYSPTNTVVAKKEGMVDLPPASIVPVFIPDFFSGSQAVARAFITFDTPKHLWFRSAGKAVSPQVTDVRFGELDMPRVSAIATNPSAYALSNVTFIVTLFDKEDTAIGASRTVVPSIPAHGSVPLVFTWPSSFSVGVARIEVVPVVSLEGPLLNPLSP